MVSQVALDNAVPTTSSLSLSLAVTITVPILYDRIHCLSNYVFAMGAVQGFALAWFADDLANTVVYLNNADKSSV